MLKRHPQIKSCGELVSNYSKDNPEKMNQFLDYLNELERESDLRYEAFGFKLMYSQLRNKPSILMKLVSSNYKIMHLIRENYLDSILSLEIARRSGIYHAGSKVDIEKINLEPTWLLKKLSKRDRNTKLMRTLLSVLPNPVLTITYENLFLDKESTLLSILRFLEIKNISLEFSFQSYHTKINEKSYRETISNYEDVEAALEGTKFYDFLFS